jgi:cation diffusion facilitator family transporter
MTSTGASVSSPDASAAPAASPGGSRQGRTRHVAVDESNMTPRTPGEDGGRGSNESARTVLIALAAGIGVALAKAGAAIVTGSSALAAEASHSLADTANDVFLVVAQRRSIRSPNERHPMGYGREAYFWALIAACAAFVAGAAFSLRDGIDELLHPSETSSFAVAYIVLAIAAAFDLVSFRQSAGQLIGRARRHDRDVLEESRVTSDPTLRAVFVSDTVAISGDAIAFAALALDQLTGSSVPQGVGAVLIGVVLVRISLRLGKRAHDFLVGVWVLVPAPQAPDADDFTQPIRPAEAERLEAAVSAYPGITAIRELLFWFSGPGQLWVVARVDVDDDLRAADVKSLVRGIEARMRQESENIQRVDVVPVGGDQRARLGDGRA